MTRRPGVALLTLTLALAAPAFGQEGLDLFVKPEKGHCIACHQLPESVGPVARNDLGPKLEGERMRLLGKAGIREIIEDAPKRNPDSVMPPYGHHRILDAREIERIAEFLHALP